MKRPKKTPSWQTRAARNARKNPNRWRWNRPPARVLESKPQAPQHG